MEKNETYTVIPYNQKLMIESMAELEAELFFKNCPIPLSRLRVLAESDLKKQCFVSDAALGDDVSYIPKFNGKPYCGVQKGHIQAISFTKSGTRVKIREHHPHNMDFALGKTAFLDQESAEKALTEVNP